MQPTLATLSDLEQIWSLFCQCRTLLLQQNISQWDETYPTPEILLEDITNGHAFVLRDEQNQLLSYFTMNDKEDLPYALSVKDYAPPAHAFLIHRLCVRPDLQGQGIGHLMVNFAEQHAKQCGYRAVLLTVFSENHRAMELYHSLDYRCCGSMVFEPNRPPAYNLYKII